VYKIITDELQGSGVTKEMALQMAVKAINDTAGPDGLVPTLLVCVQVWMLQMFQLFDK
jgi:hypothetical protein